MKPIFLLSLAALSMGASEETRSPVFESSFQSRVGFDSNSVGTSGASAAILGGRDTLTFAAGTNLGIGLFTAPAVSSLKLSFGTEAMRFTRWSDENYTTSRLGLSGQVAAGAWKYAGEASTLFVAGSRDTLASVGSVNANGVALWRERRRQWQHRVKLQAQTSFGNCEMRAVGTLLDCDYRTNMVAGKVPFADRSDAQVALDCGWRQNESSLWIVGIRGGEQSQAIVPLADCEFDYSNTYRRLAVGWEGKYFKTTRVTFATGPDFRHYFGAIDRRVWHGDRDRTSMWFEGGFTSKPVPALTVTGKTARMDWLSSTGKSAYVDTSVEIAAAWAFTRDLAARLAGKIHRCDYLPAVRDDWESFVGGGAIVKLSARTELTVDILRHWAWSPLSGVASEREFRRTVINFGWMARL